MYINANLYHFQVWQTLRNTPRKNRVHSWIWLKLLIQNCIFLTDTCRNKQKCLSGFDWLFMQWPHSGSGLTSGHQMELQQSNTVMLKIAAEFLWKWPLLEKSLKGSLKGLEKQVTAHPHTHHINRTEKQVFAVRLSC